jgi:putative aldouronate transport system substrate-binding protein
MKKATFVLSVAMLSVSVLAYGGGRQQETGASTTSNQDTVWLEMWGSHSQFGPFRADHPLNLITVPEIGVGIKAPLIPWNGGVDYLERLNLAIVSNEMPDAFQPWGGNEYELAREGAIMALDDLLPLYAPSLWNSISEDTWNIVRANSPDGKIYFIPTIWKDFSLAAFIRTDWLERVGLAMPKTIQEYETVLRAFRDKDANGNGDPSDEIPTSGRQDARWMDHLFAPFGVAMYEGNPEWDIYNGELTYAGVTPNMRAALEWVRKLYAERLLDQETLLNTTAMWDGKIRDNRVGSWYHGAQWVSSRLIAISRIDPKVQIAQLPVLKAPGFQGFYTGREYRNPGIVFSSANKSRVIAGLRYLEFYANPETRSKYPGGWPGFNVKTDDSGNLVVMPQPQNISNVDFFDIISSPEIFENSWYIQLADPKTGQYSRMALDILKSSSESIRQIAGQTLPANIYDDYPDIAIHKLFREYATLIILGEYPISKFDEFVQRWYASGGTQVTTRARKVFANIK